MHQGHKGERNGKAENKGAEAAYRGNEGGDIQFPQQRHYYAGAEQGGGGLAEGVRIGHSLVTQHDEPSQHHYAFLYNYRNHHVLGYPARSVKAYGYHKQSYLVRNRVQYLAKV